MPNLNLSQIYDILDRTGEKFVLIHDNEVKGVLVPYQEYANLISGRKSISHMSEEELINKINREVAHWQAEQDDEENY